MKRALLSILALSALILALTVTLTACGGDDGCAGGSHDYYYSNSNFPIDPESKKAEENFPEFYNDYQQYGEKVYMMYHGAFCNKCDYVGVAKHNFELTNSDDTRHWYSCDCGENYDEYHDDAATCRCGYQKPAYTMEPHYIDNGVQCYIARLSETASGEVVIPKVYEDGIVVSVWGPRNEENPGVDKDVPAITALTIPETVEYFGLTLSGLKKITVLGETSISNLEAPNLEEIDAPKATMCYYKGKSLKKLTKMVIGAIDGKTAFANVTEYPTDLEITVNGTYNGYINCPTFVKTLNLGNELTEMIAVRSWSLYGEELENDMLEVVNAPALVKIYATGDSSNKGFNGTYLSANITTINAPKLQDVADYAFANLSKLTSLELPELVYLGYCAISGTGIETFTIPNTVTGIGAFALAGNSNLKTVYYNAPRIENSITGYSTSLCLVNGSGSDVADGLIITIGKDVKTIPEGLVDTQYVVSVVFETGAAPEKICCGAFRDATGLTSITLPNSITVIDDDAFRDCYNLEAVVLPASLETIGIAAFQNTSIVNITIPSGVTTIGNYAFRWCDELESISAASSVNIPFEAIDINNHKLYEELDGHYYFRDIIVGIKAGVTELRPREGTVGFTTNVPDGGDMISFYWSRSNVLSIYVPASMNNVDFSDFYNVTTVVLSEGITDIANYAFVDCRALTSITLPSTLKTIGLCAFSGSGLTEVNLPTGVTSIGEGAFEACQSLASVSIPNTVKVIGAEAFNNCDLITTITLPESLEEMGSGALGNCALLTTINISGDFELTFEMVAGSDNYRGTAYRNGYYIGKVLVGVIDQTKFLHIKPGTTSIKNGVFAGLDQIKYVYVPASVTDYENGVFKDCASLTLIVEAASFSGHGLVGIGRVKTNKDVTEDGYGYIEQSDGITIAKYYGDEAVLTIPETINGKPITAVGAGNTTTAEAIVDATKLTVTKVVVPATVTSIAPWAFMEMEDLVEVNIPALAAGIGPNAFYGCTSLTTLTVDKYTRAELEALGITGISDNALKFTAYEVGMYGATTMETLSYDDPQFITKLTTTYATCYWFRYIDNPFNM